MWLLALALCAPALYVRANDTPIVFRLASVFGEAMTLQAGPPGARIWGWANPGTLVNITISNGTSPFTLIANGTAGDGDGLWISQLPEMAAGGPYNLALYTSTGVAMMIVYVLFGDVWLASGQSNMGYQVRNLKRC